MPWVDSATGELADAECPHCAETKQWAEDQVRALEIERRQQRAKITKLLNEAERQKVAKRDGATWKELLACWLLAFPNKRPSATGIKSARATAVFLRLESGADVESVKNAIAGAMKYPFVVFGKRRESGSQSDRADDLQDIMHINNDALFDFLRDAGEAMRARSS